VYYDTSLHHTKNSFEYMVLLDDGLVEEAEWHSILQHDNNSITKL
jgi:hypothetical protein